MNNYYSDWLKIDLHIHSDFSKQTKDNDYNGMFSVATLKQKLKDNNVEIFSITDHNIINIDAYKAYYNEYNPDIDPLLLLGVELDIEVARKAKNKIYHALLIFNCCDINTVGNISDKLGSIYTERSITDKKRRLLSIEDIAKTFSEIDFFFIPHAYSDKNIVTAYREGSIEDAQKMVLLMPCALEKATTPEIIHQYNQGFNKLLTTNFQSKNDIPYINFSDNHCVDKYPCKHKGDDGKGEHEFYYIKGSKCYESIRLAFIDPESRIKTTQQYQAITNFNNTIESVKISGDSYVAETELKFSPHLNVIIGGRSSGKSLLMWYIGKKINASVRDDTYDKYNSDNVQIKSKNDALFSLETSQSNNIYIKQGDIIDYFEKGKLSELAKKSGKLGTYNQHKDILQQRRNELTKLTDALISAYNILYDNKIGAKTILHDKTISDILGSQYIIKLDSSKLSKDIDSSVELSEASRLLSSINEAVKSLSSKKETLSINDSETQIIAAFTAFLEAKMTLVQKKQSENRAKLAFITQADDIIKKANSTLSNDARQKEISIGELDKLKQDINLRFRYLRNLAIAAKEIECVDSNISTRFDIGDDIKLVLDASINDTIKSLLIDGIKNGIASQSLYYNMIGLLLERNGMSIKNLGGNLPEKLKQKFESGLRSVYNALNSPTDYLEYEDGETSKNRSPGYNSEKYLNVILNNPAVNIVFIDQPEDNLGNKFIAEELVKLIRNIKFSKQIFLVTHNPSVVVYGDAESIILAKNEDNLISYKQIVLEDSYAQKEICNILDGGEYIFDNRYKKYNIQRILKK